MAKARGNDTVRLLGFVRRNRMALMMSTALQASAMLVLSLPVQAQPAPNARPTGGSVVAGSAAISQTTNNTQINQSSQRAAINWRSFDVGNRQSVTFNQPSASAVALNRVTGPDPSQIAGRIDANGQIILMNQSGVIFYKGAQVNTAGLIVTTANMTDKNFMAGKLKFDQASQNPNAAIDNAGNVTIKEAGLAALVAPQVRNSGTITAQLGHVVLAGAKTATLDLYGDGMLSLDVTDRVTQAPAGKDGKTVTALVTNTGVVTADGGTVQLTARAADGIVQNLVEAGGRIRAATMGDRTGLVALNGVGGSIIVEGQLSAPGHAPGTKAGAIEVVSNGNVTVASTAKINASGKAGGGVVALGTTLARAKGGASVTPIQMAANTVIQSGARVGADAIVKGDGGRVAVLSAGGTSMAGTVAAKGGPQGGNGGEVEVSGGAISLTGFVDASAPHGTRGGLLLDPSDLWVSDTKPAIATFVITGDDLPTVLANKAPDANTVSWVSPSQLVAQKADISLAATNNLFVASSFGTANTLNLGDYALSLTAGKSLTIDRGFKIDAGSISLTSTGGAITIGGTSGVMGGLITASQLGALPPAQVTGDDIVLNAGPGGIALTAGATLGESCAIIDITSAGPVSEDKASIIAGSSLTSLGGVTGKVGLLGSSNAIDSLGDFTVTNGDLIVVNGGDLTLRDTIKANNLFFEVAKKGGTIRFLATDDCECSPASLNAATGGRISLVADQISNTSFVGVISVPSGTLEVAPFSPINVSMNGTSAVGQLLIDAALLSAVTPALNTLVIGGFTNVPVGASTSTPSAASITIDGALDLAPLATKLNLEAIGPVEQSAPILNVGTLLGTTGSTTLANSGNRITTLGNYTATSGLALTNAADLLVAGLVTTGGTAAFTIAGALTETTGSLTAATLTGSAETSASLTQPTNKVGTLGAFSTTAGFSLVDDHALLVAGPVQDTGAASSLALTTKTGDITLAGTVSAANIVDLIAAAAINQTGGMLTAATLTGSAGTSASLTQPTNKVGTLGAFSTTAGFSLVDDQGLRVAGPVQDTGAASSLALTTKTGDITLAGTVSAANIVDLIAAAAINQTGGVLTAATLTGSAGTSASLTQPTNKVGTLGAFSTTAGFSLVDDQGLRVAGPVQDTGAASSLALTTKTGDITLAGTVSAANIVDLIAAAAINQTGGALTAATLTGSAGTSASLTQPTNKVGTLGAFSTTAGFSLVDDQGLRVAGPVQDTGAASSLALTTKTGDITLAGTVSAANIVDLIAAAAINQTGGVLTAATLTGSAGTSASLTQPTNKVGTLGAFSTTAGFSLVDGQGLRVAGPVQDTGAASSLALTTKTGDITLAGTVSAANIVDLIAAAAINQTGGALTAATLTGSAGKAVDLTGINRIGSVGNFTSASFTLNDSVDLLIAGELNAPSIAVMAPTNQISLGDGATIVTTSGLLQSVNFVQIGTSTVLGQGGGPSTLRISTTGTQRFDLQLGLQATGTTLNLDLHGGTAAGNVLAKALEVTFDTPGGTSLTGTIAGVTGGPAAAVGTI